MIDFMTIKNNVSVPYAAEYYGIEDRHGMCRCIFHDEDTPSMKLYQNNYHCFGCGAHGDVIDLVQQIFSISPAEAAKRLNSDFNLGLDMDKPADSRKIELLKQRRREHDEFVKWDRKAFITVVTYFKLLRRWREEYAPQDEKAAVHHLFAESLSEMSRIEYLLQIMTFGSIDEKKAIRDEVERIEHRLQEHDRGCCTGMAG